MKIVSGKQFIRMLKKRGWKLTATSGSHHKFSHPDYRDHIAVSVHGNRDLGVGMQKKLMKTAGINESDL